MSEEKITYNTGRLCSVYCPHCRRVTDKISFNLLREAGTVEVSCAVCGRISVIEYDGKKASVWHY
jgi:ribosomal protein S27E